MFWKNMDVVSNRAGLLMQKKFTAFQSKRREIVKKKDSELPGFGISLLPVLLPVVLISMVTFMGLAAKFGIGIPTEVARWLEFIGNKNVAMFIAALIAMYTLAKQRGWVLAKLGE